MAEQNLSSDLDTRPPNRIDVKEAVQLAHSYLRRLYDGQELPNLRLEEVELSDDGRYWLVTLGFTGEEEEVEHSAFLKSMEGKTVRPRRDYKLITIDASSGEPISMKMRAV